MIVGSNKNRGRHEEKDRNRENFIALITCEIVNVKEDIQLFVYCTGGWVRQFEFKSVCVCVCMGASVRVSVCSCERVFVWACVRVRVWECVCERVCACEIVFELVRGLFTVVFWDSSFFTCQDHNTIYIYANGDCNRSFVSCNKASLSYTLTFPKALSHAISYPFSLPQHTILSCLLSSPTRLSISDTHSYPFLWLTHMPPLTHTFSLFAVMLSPVLDGFEWLLILGTVHHLTSSAFNKSQQFLSKSFGKSGK